MSDSSLAQSTTAIILAGGRGTRIAALIPNTPKPMVPVAGLPFLEWIFRRLTREKITNIVLSIGYQAEVVTTWLMQRSAEKGQNIHAHIEAQPLGTGGAVADALQHVDTPYVVILNGDTLLLTDFAPALHRLQSHMLNGVIIARHLDDTGRYGRLEVADGLLKQFQEKQSGAGLINGGVYVFDTDWLKHNIGAGISSIEVDVFPRFLREGARIGIEVTKAPFIDIGTPETLSAAEAFVQEHKNHFE